MLVRIIIVNATTAMVYSPYDARDLIRAVPGRRWHPDERAWTIPPIYVDDLSVLLTASGYTVTVTDDRPKSNRPPGGPDDNDDGNPDGWSRRRGPSTTDWASRLLTAADTDPAARPGLAARTYKALARVLHPDAGGSTALMQQLNVAADRILDQR